MEGGVEGGGDVLQGRDKLGLVHTAQQILRLPFADCLHQVCHLGRGRMSLPATPTIIAVASTGMFHAYNYMYVCALVNWDKKHSTCIYCRCIAIFSPASSFAVMQADWSVPSSRCHTLCNKPPASGHTSLKLLANASPPCEGGKHCPMNSG